MGKRLVYVVFAIALIVLFAGVMRGVPPNETDYLVIGISFILPVIIVEIVKASKRKSSSRN